MKYSMLSQMARLKRSSAYFVLDDEGNERQSFAQAHVVGQDTAGLILRLAPKHPNVKVIKPLRITIGLNSAQYSAV